MAATIAGGHGLATVVASLLANIATNFATPSQPLNDAASQVIRAGLAAIDPIRASGFVLIWGWNHEDLAGQPLHWFLVLLTIIALIRLRHCPANRDACVFLSATGLSFVLLCAVTHSGTYGIRYQLAIMAMAAPVFGLVGEQAFPNRTARFGSFLLLALAVPYVLFGRSRPLIALKATREPYSIPCLPGLGCTMGSILIEPPTTALFSSYLELREPYREMASVLARGTCRDVGLRIDSHDPEYLLWWILGAPELGFRLESGIHLRDSRDMLILSSSPVSSSARYAVTTGRLSTVSRWLGSTGMPSCLSVRALWRTPMGRIEHLPLATIDGSRVGMIGFSGQAPIV